MYLAHRKNWIILRNTIKHERTDNAEVESKLIKEEKPDIVHMHSSKAGIIGRIMISSKNRKLFYILT